MSNKLKFQVVKLGKESLPPVSPDHKNGPYLGTLAEAMTLAADWANNGYTAIIYFDKEQASFCGRRLGHYNPHNTEEFCSVPAILFEVLETEQASLDPFRPPQEQLH